MKKILVIVLIFGSTLVGYSQQVKIMTYNIRHAEDMNSNIDVAQVAAVINKYKPDIVALQEVDSVTNRCRKVDQMKELGRLTGMRSVFGRHFAYDSGAYGLGILSKYKIRKVENYRLPYYKDDASADSRGMLVATLKIKKQALYFATVHLDYKKDSMRTIQAKNLVAHFMQQQNLPLILAGDFNADPKEESIAVIQQWFQQLDKNDKTHTYPADKPTIKIDYIFLSPFVPGIVVKQEVLEEKVASDHRPVLGVIDLKRKGLK